MLAGHLPNNVTMNRTTLLIPCLDELIVGYLMILWTLTRSLHLLVLLHALPQLVIGLFAHLPMNVHLHLVLRQLTSARLEGLLPTIVTQDRLLLLRTVSLQLTTAAPDLFRPLSLWIRVLLVRIEVHERLLLLWMTGVHDLCRLKIVLDAVHHRFKIASLILQLLEQMTV